MTEICIDFDGTIVEHDYPRIGNKVPYAIEYMLSWIEAGHLLILFTMRSGPELDAAVKYLKGCGVTLHGINENPTQKKWTSSPKAYGQVYIDDAAFGCPLIHPADGRRPYVDWSKVGPNFI